MQETENIFLLCAYTYDNNGNLIEKIVGGNKITYTYDFNNKLTKITLPEGRIETYTYSGDGKRILANINGSVVKYIFDGLIPVLEMGTDYTKFYTKIPSIPGGIGGLISSYDGANTFYYYDSHLGNVNMITDESANIVKTYNYDAFGNVVNETGTLEQRYMYKTKEKSNLDDLIYFGARYYDCLLYTSPSPRD